MLNINTAEKQNFFYVKYTKKTIIFIKLMKKLSMLNYYLLIKKKNQFYFKISPFFYKNKKNFRKFKLISTCKKKIFISLKALKLLNKRSGSSVYLISTPKGLIFHGDAIKNKTGGLV